MTVAQSSNLAGYLHTIKRLAIVIEVLVTELRALIIKVA